MSSEQTKAPSDVSGRISIAALMDEARSFRKADGFERARPHPFILQLNEAEADHTPWRTQTPVAASSPLQKPFHAFAVAKRTGANPFAFVTLGRAPNNDIVLPYPAISKFHASFNQSNGKWTITDASSSNGSKVDGEVLPGGKALALRSGATLELGGAIRLSFLGPRETWEFLETLRQTAL